MSEETHQYSHPVFSELGQAAYVIRANYNLTELEPQVSTDVYTEERNPFEIGEAGSRTDSDEDSTVRYRTPDLAWTRGMERKFAARLVQPTGSTCRLKPCA